MSVTFFSRESQLALHSNNECVSCKHIKDYIINDKYILSSPDLGRYYQYIVAEQVECYILYSAYVMHNNYIYNIFEYNKSVKNALNTKNILRICVTFQYYFIHLHS